MLGEIELGAGRVLTAKKVTGLGATAGMAGCLSAGEGSAYRNLDQRET